MDDFRVLTSPVKLGSLRLKHRMIRGPMWTILASMDGEATQQLIDHYVSLSKGGASLIMIESVTPHERNGWHSPTLRLDDAVVVASFNKLVKSIHLEGVPALVQLTHAGPFGRDPVSPSGLPTMMGAQVGIVTPRAMSLEEIETTRDNFINAAVLARDVGCQGVEIHGATAYLLHQFHSPHSNKRTDKYGGSLENRMRLALEIIRGIRKKCGPEFVIGYTVVADELLPDGVTYDDSLPFVKAMEREGVDFIDVNLGTYETMASSETCPGHSKYTRFGLWEHTRRFKNEFKIPIIHRASGDYDPHSWEKHLEAGDADIVQMAKQLLCDPAFPRKVLEGRLEDIRFCVCCMFCNNNLTLGRKQLQCAINPAASRERDYAITRVPAPKKVIVVGGGPGGLEAARVAAERGHDVTLMEKASELGGKLKFLSLCVNNEQYRGFYDWEIRQGKNAGVKFVLNTEVTPETIQQAKPDVVILATGAARHIVPDIPGINKPQVVTPEDVLTGKAKLGKKVVVLGGDRIGTDVAYTIAKKGMAESVTIVEPKPVNSIGYDMEVNNMAMITMALLPKLKVQGFTGTRVEEIKDGQVTLISPEGKKRKVDADTVVLSMGYTPDQSLYEALSGKVKELYAIGDCVTTRNVAEAVHEGAYRARQI